MNKNELRILLLGDSTVWGSVPRMAAPGLDPLETVIRKRLASEPGLPPAEVFNRARDNDTVRDLLANGYDQATAGVGQLTHIFIRYGINDSVYLKDVETEFPATYHRLIANLRRDQPDALITIETIIPYRPPEPTQEMNARIRRIAAEEGLPVLDTHAAFAAELRHGAETLTYRRLALKDVPEKVRPLVPQSAIFGDDVILMDNLLDVYLRDVPNWLADRHPNPAGYQVIGRCLADYIISRREAK